MQWSKIVKNQLPIDPNLDELSLQEIEDDMIHLSLEDSKKNIHLKQFLKEPYDTLCTYPQYTFIFSIPVSLTILVFGIIFVWPNPLIDDIIFFSVLLSMFPASIMYHKKMQHINKVEEYLPTFLRDISEMNYAGLTFSKAVATAAKGEYGELSCEVNNMDNLMSWGISFEEALLNFAYRTNTTLINRSVSLVIQASRAGGRVSQALEAAAQDATEIKLLERERKGNMIIYVSIIYLAFFVFIFVVGMLATTFVPTMANAGNSVSATGSSYTYISAFQPDSFIRLMFHASLIQGFFSGLVAGQMGEGAVSAGLKHSIVLSLIAWIAFTFLI
jgi:archaeal flagellar protein FlaJ